MNIPRVTLNNGVLMPQIGLGTWQIEEGESVETAVKAALDTGYRHIDTAALYGNEEGVGKAIRDSGIPREEVFVTSKLAGDDHGYEEAKKGFEKSMRKLGFDYLDLFLIHWPNPEQGKYVETWQAFEELHQEGRIKAIGVSNFKKTHLNQILGKCQVVPAVNQIELHPHFNQKDIRDYCRKKDIYVESYSPLKRASEIMEEETIVSIADNHGKTPAQVVLRWHIQHDLIVIPKSTTPERIKENIDIFNFELSREEMNAIDDLDKGDRTLYDPEPGVE